MKQVGSLIRQVGYKKYDVQMRPYIGNLYLFHFASPRVVNPKIRKRDFF